MFKQIENQLNIELGLNWTSNKFLLAVSGGMDSMLLLHFFNEMNLTYEVAHVNYQLRGSDSDLDEALVKNTCAELGVVCHVWRDKKCIAIKDNKSIQELAREVRYHFFKGKMAERNCDFLVTAHHFNDDLETFLINFGRGSGVRGLKGIPKQYGNVIRPLLMYSKSEIVTEVKERGIAYREDKSNKSNDYLRNALRNKVIPAWEEEVGKEGKGWKKSMLHLKRLDAFISRSILAFEEKGEKRKFGIVWSAKDIQDLDPFFFEMVLNYWEFNEREFSKISKAIISGKTGVKFLSKSKELLINREEVILRSIRKGDFSAINVDQNIERVGDYQFQIKDKKEVEFELGNDYLDYKKLVFPLEIRTWKHGDKFQPLGMKGEKLVSDFLTDIKLNLFEKESVKVLVSTNEIVAVIGYRISEKFKIADTTEKVYIVQQLGKSDGRN